MRKSELLTSREAGEINVCCVCQWHVGVRLYAPRNRCAKRLWRRCQRYKQVEICCSLDGPSYLKWTVMGPCHC